MARNQVTLTTDKKIFKSGTSRAVVIPDVVVKANGIEAGQVCEVLWNGADEVTFKFKKSGVIA
ncbi:MAG: hypothetical protein PHC68_17660 [Syntrophorhabdaceae bacterium]|nr:hypothetical protein [Syntrophorhabdaceae bacterium]